MLPTTSPPDGMGVGVEKGPSWSNTGVCASSAPLSGKGYSVTWPVRGSSFPCSLEVCRKPDVACAISHQAMRAGVGCLQLELSHLAGYRVEATQRIRFLSGVPERAIGGQRRIMGVGVGRGHIPLFAGDLCRRSVTAGLDSRLFSGKARNLEMVAE